jgi:hypothetical protein
MTVGIVDIVSYQAKAMERSGQYSTALLMCAAGSDEDQHDEKSTPIAEP